MILPMQYATQFSSFKAYPGAYAANGLPAYVKRSYAYLQCGILAHGFVRLGCDTCPHQMLLAFSCKKRGFCPACAGRRMA